jgi:FixJ family two-component response regulator
LRFHDVPDSADTICLLDDEPSVLKALARLLASDGLHAQKFCDPACFLEHARSHPVRLAVIDIRLPGITGLEVLAALRVSSPDTRVIVMTGENNPAHRSEAMAGGASAFFFKPFDDRAFLASVRGAIMP